MRPRDEFTALRDIKIPDSWAFGYRTGDNVPAQVVEDWGLSVGYHVMPANENVIARPTTDDPREKWEAYAIGQGVDSAEARNLDRDQLIDACPEAEHDPAAAQRLRPAESVRKSDWVEHVVSRGANREWAESSTKAELMEWTPDTPTGPAESADAVADQGNAANG